MGDFSRLALVHGLVGFEVYTFGFLRSVHNNTDEKAVFITGYLLFLIAAVLLFLLAFGDLKGNRIVTIVTMLCFFSAGEKVHALF